MSLPLSHYTAYHNALNKGSSSLTVNIKQLTEVYLIMSIYFLSLQAQRDYFGAHTYERLDNPGQFVHTNWTGHGGNVSSTTYDA